MHKNINSSKNSSRDKIYNNKHKCTLLNVKIFGDTSIDTSDRP